MEESKQSKQEEKLNAPIDVHSPDPAVKALIEKMPTATNLEGLGIALAIQQLVRGQDALLEKLNQNDAKANKASEEMAKLRKAMAKMDKAAKKWEEDRDKFIEEVYNKADALRMTDAQREQLTARESLNLQDKIQKARAELVNDKKRFEETLAAEPKEIVTSPGRHVTTSDGKGMQMARILPEEVRIKHMVWVFQPYVPTEVPHSVAEHLRNRWKSAQETQRRQEAMMKNMESGDLELEMKKIDAEFHSSTERL